MQLKFDKAVEVFYIGQKRILDFYSIWPQQSKWKRLLHCINFWHVFIFWILIFDLILILHIGIHIRQLSEVIKGFFLLSTCIAYTLKVISFKLNNVALLQLFDELHLRHYCPEDEEDQLIFARASVMSRMIYKYYGILSVSSLTMMLITQYAIDNTQLPLDTYNPFNEESGTFGFIIMYWYHCVALSMACFMNISFDSLCCSMFIFVKCQLDILALRLQKLGYNCEEHEKTQLQLKHCIEFYMRIVELSARIEELVYKPISAQVFCSVLVLTANFYAMSLLSDEKLVFLKYFIYQSCMLSQLFILCYFAGEIAQRSSELPHELYKCNWVSWQRTNRRLMLMFMQRLDMPIRIRTLNASHAFDLALFSALIIPAAVMAIKASSLRKK